MKKSICVYIISVLAVIGCIGQENPKKSVIASQIKNEADLLDFYSQYGTYTDPGEYAYLYEHLPDSLLGLCRLIRSQYINYGWELDNYRELIPKERWNESAKYPTVKSALEGLLSYDSRGLVKDRIPANRLMLICRDNALLLASILKYRGIPARVRYGFAPYLIPGFHSFHVICEVWNEKDKRWMLVDPSAGMVDFSREEFDFSYDVWVKMQHKEIDPALYGMMGKFTGLVPITLIVCTDLASLLGNEYPVGQYPPLFDDAVQNNNQFTAKQTEMINRICELMKSVDADNLSELQDIYNNTPQFQFTKSFDPRTITNENDAGVKVASINKPNIEFVDIPGGTFIMGSPETEVGRKDDEVQHEITVSAFKMSKYTITREQYELFIKATGRIMKYYRPVGGAKHPAMWVTWYDASAFAEWMGCRLPTEAEFEYATRAGTTTPFYTGDCLTTDQANFNNKLTWSPVPVGSFPPNAFGLYDMHGNMVEWCSDWYGVYNINDKINPKGPGTGDIKVFRGGGFWLPAANCRSACRGGDPPINRGNGLSFRVVKDK